MTGRLPGTIYLELRNGNGGCFKARHHRHAVQSGAQAHAVQTLARSLVRPGQREERLDCVRFIATLSRSFLTRSAAKTLHDCPPVSEFGFICQTRRLSAPNPAAREQRTTCRDNPARAILRVSRAESAHEIDGEANQQDQAKPAAADDGAAKVKPAAAKQEKQNHQEQ